MQAPKNGFFYVIDAKTGELISADNFAPVNWASGVDLKTGRPIENPEARFDQTGKVAFVTPTGRGAHNWQPMSFNPNTGLVYFGSRHNAQAYIPMPAKDFKVSNVGTNVGLVRPVPDAVTAELEARPDLQFEDRGAMLGWDPVARKPRWRYVDKSGGGDGGTLSTAGNLMFAGGGERQFIAYDAATGERIWHFTAQTGVAAGPISYEIDGEQYVAVAAGRGLQPYYQPNYSRLLAFKLGGTAQLPPMLDYTPPALDPPESTASAEVLTRGAAVYGQNCVQCHGNTIGTFPDLRVSPAIKSQELFDAIVLQRRARRERDGVVRFASDSRRRARGTRVRDHARDSREGCAGCGGRACSRRFRPRRGGRDERGATARQLSRRARVYLSFAQYGFCSSLAFASTRGASGASETSAPVESSFTSAASDSVPSPRPLPSKYSSITL